MNHVILVRLVNLVNQLLLLNVVDGVDDVEAVGRSPSLSFDINLPSLLHLTFLYYF